MRWMNGYWKTCACVLSAAVAGGAALAADVPAVFGSRTVKEAIEAGRAEGKLVVLDATASWCVPCKSMDATTWSDGAVAAWIKQHAIAAQFDVDKDAESGRTYNIAGMPTIIAIKDGREFDRVMGYKTGEQLLGWLQGVQEGKTEAQQAKADDMPLRQRFRLAWEKVRSGRLNDALADYMWLWENLDRVYPNERFEKTDSLVVTMREMRRRLPECQAKFEKMRQDLEGKSREDAGVSRDYIAMCRVLDDEAAVLKWFDDCRKSEVFPALWKESGEQVEQVLISHSRWRDAGVLIERPLERLRATWDVTVKNVAKMRAEDRMEETIVAEQSRYRAEAARMYVALLAADRDTEAAALAAEAAKTDPSPFTLGTMLGRAMDEGQGRTEQLEWLTPSISSVVDLADARRRIEEQVAGRKK